MTDPRLVAWPGASPSVGQSAERSRLVTEEDIVGFTDLSGDRNPLHYDEDLARASIFGARIVQGSVTTAILNAVVAEDQPGPGTVFLNVAWDFRAAVRPGGYDHWARRGARGPARQAHHQAAHNGHAPGRRRRREGTAVCNTVPLGTRREGPSPE